MEIVIAPDCCKVSPTIPAMSPEVIEICPDWDKSFVPSLKPPSPIIWDPETISISPPTPPEDEEPAKICTLPPVNSLLLPAEIEIAAPAGPADEPADKVMEPEFPAEVSPVVTEKAPTFPAVAPPILMLMLPVLDSDASAAVDKLIEPEA